VAQQHDDDPAVAGDRAEQVLQHEPWYRRARERARARRTTDVAWRLSVFALGWTIVAAGVAMLVLPGPGWAAIFLGLAVLASEFAWANHLLARARAWAGRAAVRFRDPRVRRRNLVLLTLGCGVAVALLAAYVARFGVSLDGPRSWF
jgi:uncharacterized protein (TIGR02611 family)